MIPFLPTIIFVCFVVFLYAIFVFAKDDFMLLRKNVSLEQLFNISFLGLLISLFAARLGHVIAHPSKDYFNPLVFLLFSYFPGLSIGGGIVGTALFFWLYYRKKKVPVGRIFDIFVLGFLSAFACGAVIAFILQWIFLKKIFIISFIAAIVIISLTYLFIWFFTRGNFKDGSIGMVALVLLGIIELLTNTLSRGLRHILAISVEDILLLVIVIFFLSLFIVREGYASKKK